MSQSADTSEPSKSQQNSDDERTTNTLTTLFDENQYEENKSEEVENDRQELNIPKQPSVIKLLDLSAATIKENTTHSLDIAREETENSDTISTSQNINKNGIISSVEIDTELFDLISSHITALVDEIKLFIFEDGWYTSFVDAKNVAMGEIWIDKSDFESYEFEHKHTVGVPISTITDFTDYSPDEGTIEFNIEFTESGYEEIVINDGFETRCNLINTDSIRQTPSIPNLRLTTEFTLPGIDMKRIARNASKVGDHIGIHATKNDTIEFRDKNTRGEEYKKCYSSYKDLSEYRNKSISQYNFNINVQNPSTSLFSIRYLKDMFNHKNQKVRANYEFKTGDEMPIKIRREVGKNSEITMMLAPRIRSE